jgi:hypothetical protein
MFEFRTEEFMSDVTMYSWIKYIIGINGLCYAVLSNEQEAENYMEELGGVSIACCNGYMNGVLVTETIGM